MTTFRELGASDALLDALRDMGIKEPTPVQEQAIPVVRAGRDTIVQAQTGTGKTVAFLLPLLLKIKPQADVTQALVVTPTRELAIQIAKVATKLGRAVDVTSLVIYGGQDIERQKLRLRRHPQLIIGTPGRLLDHVRRHTIDLSQVNKVVLDEADEMLKLGFIEDVEQLLKQTAHDRQLGLFSATMPDRVKALARQFMHEPERIEIKGEHVTLDSIEQVIIDTHEDTKVDRLCELINAEQPYLMMVFCHTKQRVHQLTMELARRGYLVDELHGDLTQTQRALVLRRFRQAELQILCATDIAARGLDIEGVTHVVSYDIPHDADTYIHRIGRTGRAGEAGKAITFVNSRQYDLLRRIEAGIKARLEKTRSARAHHKQHAARQQKVVQELKKKRLEHKSQHQPHKKRPALRGRRPHKARTKSNATHRSRRRF